MADDTPGSPRVDPAALRAREGLPGAFETLLKQYNGAIYRQILLVVNNDHSAAEDVAQETWWRIARGVRRFEGRSGFYAWACRIARNEARRWLGRNARPARLRPPRGEEDGEDDPAARREQSELVHAALRKLPQKFVTPLLLELWEDMSLKEIAHALGVPVGTVKSRLHRARERFREVWDEMNQS